MKLSKDEKASLKRVKKYLRKDECDLLALFNGKWELTHEDVSALVSIAERVKK